MSRGKSIELFLVNGTADSLITAELSNWNGKAIKIPRIEISDCKRSDIEGAGVYFLFCKDDDGSESVYIGESENVKTRLLQHITDYNAGKEKYYWNWAVSFVGRDLNKALIRYLEDGLVQIARSSNRFDVLTKNTHSNTVLKESQVAAMEEFIENVKILINALGYKVLEPLRQNDAGTSKDDEEFHIEISDYEANGLITTEGFVLLAGATISNDISTKSLNNGLIKQREKYENSDAVEDRRDQGERYRRTTQDILFSSSSAAADFVLGYSVSGPRTWKNKAGKSLKELDL